MSKTVRTTRETPSGRNTGFHDRKSGANMNRTTFVRKIEQGQYPDYHVRVINGVKTPVSNPDHSEKNNLG